MLGTYIVQQIDRTLANSLESLLDYIRPKDGLLVGLSSWDYGFRTDGSFYQANRLGSVEDLCLDFTYPGYDIELRV